jgi:hypothetical protein
MKTLYTLLSAASLAVCFAAPFLFLQQAVTEQTYKGMLVVASITWFVFATLRVSRR